MNLAWILLLAMWQHPGPSYGYHHCSADHTHDCQIGEDGAHDYYMMFALSPTGSDMWCYAPKPHELTCMNEDAEVWATSSTTVNYLPEHPKPEPMDIPAVQETRTVETCNMWPCGEKLSHQETMWTCADKTRVLLTSENGKKHCIKFPEAP